MEVFQVGMHDNILLVDMGYLLFYRYHATMKNLQFQEKADTITTEELVETFKKHLDQQLLKLIKKYKLQKGGIFFCKDAKQHTVWRNDLYPEYKATRGVATEPIRELKLAMYEIAAQHGSLLGIDRLEADDIAYFASQAIQKVHKDANIYILSTDRDYLQIMDGPNTHLVDATGKEIKGVGDHQHDLWIKILMGDKSDNIPPICKGVGKKTAEKLAVDAAVREEFVNKKGCRDVLERNETLIRFDKIPLTYKETFERMYQFV